MNTFREKISHAVQSSAFRRILVSLLLVICVFVIFQAGVEVGFKKASFGRTMNDHYEENFGPMRGGLGRPGVPNANGAAGKIISVNGAVVIVSERDNAEKSVVINDQTAIRFMHQDGTASQLVPGAFVVAIGDPNEQGQIVAKFIRIMPAPPN